MTTASARQTSDTKLPSDLKVELWKRIDRRLHTGEVLITNEQFFKAMVRDFSRLVGVAPDRPAKGRILEMIIHVNQTHPETYLSAGIKNAIKAFFESTDDDAVAREMIVRMVREGRTSMWLEGMGIDVDPRLLTGAVEQAIISIVEGKGLRSSAPRRQKHKRPARRAVAMAGVSTTNVNEPSSEPVEPPACEPDPTEQEQAERIGEEKTRAEEVAGEEIGRAPRNLQSYIQQKLLSEEEAADLKKLYGIDKQLADGDIDEAEANRLRSEIEEVVRQKLESRLREAVDHTVPYINVFEALRRMPQERDEALRLLIRHKNQVVDEDSKVILSVVTSTLNEDEDLLEEIGMLMERKDLEMRMMAANMPPYKLIYTPGQVISKFTIQETFVDDLRKLSREDLSDRLNSEDAEKRTRAAADIKCMVALLTGLLKNTTPFHKEVRRLRIVLRMKRLFNDSGGEKEGRGRVQQFLRRRLHTLYPDLSRDERVEIDSIGNKIMEGRGDEKDDADNAKRIYRV